MKQPHLIDAAGLARMIDLSAVQASNTEDDVHELASLALQHGFVAAHVLPGFTAVLRKALPRGGPTLVGGPVGFPAGGNATAIKVAEAHQLVADGAEEFDMVVNIGRLRSGQHEWVAGEIRAVMEAIAPLPLKAILEIYYLDDDQIKRGCEAAIKGGAAFVKTGTGWTPPATTIERIRQITDFVGNAIEVKASGGIRSLATAAQLIALGVTRFGVSTAAAIDILEACRAQPGGLLAIPSRESVCERLDAVSA